MFDFLAPFKAWLAAGFVAIVAGLVVAVKILTMQNKAKAKEIETLENNAEVVGKMNQDMVEAAEFKGEVKAKAEAVSDTVNKLNEKTKAHNEKVAKNEKPNTTNITI